MPVDHAHHNTSVTPTPTPLHITSKREIYPRLGSRLRSGLLHVTVPTIAWIMDPRPHINLEPAQLHPELCHVAVTDPSVTAHCASAIGLPPTTALSCLPASPIIGLCLPQTVKKAKSLQTPVPTPPRKPIKDRPCLVTSQSQINCASLGCNADVGSGEGEDLEGRRRGCPTTRLQEEVTKRSQLRRLDYTGMIHGLDSALSVVHPLTRLWRDVHVNVQCTW
jgi:hypothetical protein